LPDPTEPRSGRGSAPARAALAGNPSDGYGGAVLAVAVGCFTAEAVASPVVAPQATTGGERELVDAAVRRFHAELAPVAEPARVEFSTTIPRCVGLGGSSAIVIATLRALCERQEVVLAPDAMAELALSIEVDDLGIAAGLQDRVAQCYGGVTFMEFSGPEPRYERLDGVWLPPLLVAWRLASAEHSGLVHGDLRRRFDSGERAVRTAMAALAEAARHARAALLAADHDSLARCVDQSYDARARIIELDPRHVAMIELARAAGAAANYTGSGGAIVCVCHDPQHRVAVARALGEAGCGIAEL
jgi:glucuronokinase